jgi:hypothetical protein
MRRVSWWRVLLAAACAAWFVEKAVWTNTANQWDFRVYYSSAQAWRSGADPYDTASLPDDLRAAGFKFNYPPYALGLFSPLSTLPFERARLVYIAVKLAALAWLLRIWGRLLGTGLTEPAWLLFVLLAYSSAIFVDVVAGSVTTFEQCLVWSGVAALRDNRSWTYVAMIVAASLFRLTPIVLLVACLAAGDRRGLVYVGGGIAALAAVLAITYLVSPRLTLEFFRSVPTNYGETGRLNPASLPLMSDVAAVVARSGRASLPSAFPYVAYAAVAAGVAAITWSAAARVAKSGASNAVELVFYLVALAQPLALPRFKNYSYMLLIPATYFVATRSTRLRRALPLLVIACLPIYSWMTSPDNIALLANYASWLIALGAWMVMLYELHRGGLLEYGRRAESPIAAPVVA